MRLHVPRTGQFGGLVARTITFVTGVNIVFREDTERWVGSDTPQLRSQLRRVLSPQLRTMPLHVDLQP
jgi:hypothetical protein